MSRITKLITALLLTIFCVSLFTVTVMAVGEENSNLEVVPGGDSEIVTPTEAPPAIADPTDPIIPDVTDPIVTEVPTTVYVEPATQATTSYYEEPVTQAPTYIDNDYDDDYDNDYNSSDNSYQSGQVNNESQNTEPPAPLYDSNHKIDDTELSNNDWKEISANLANAGDISSDGDDFSFIQKNNSTGDNGYIILIMGFVCLMLGVSGIIYLIASKISRNKKLSGNMQYATAGSSNRYRSNDDYDDGYKSSKYDTADVNLSKSGSRYKNGGRRYK